MQGKNVYHTQIKDNQGVIIIGSESHGIRENVMPFVSCPINIPRAEGSQTESLNASVAAGIIISEVFRKNLRWKRLKILIKDYNVKYSENNDQHKKRHPIENEQNKAFPNSFGYTEFKHFLKAHRKSDYCYSPTPVVQKIIQFCWKSEANTWYATI